ncbi:MAG: nucleoside deaminase [Tenericutes bacterium]|nr:nucleoside deaminase [Mycoplasmatota bacterium]
MFDEKIIEKLYKLSLQAYKKGEIPVSAIIVKNNKVISKAYNKRNKSHNPMDHAEIIAIKRACKRLHTWKLNECVLYVSLEPCDMCREAINQSRIENVIYFTKNNKIINFKTNYKFLDSSYNIKFSKLLTNFFETKR